MNKYEALETMLENIFERGADIENSLAEFPEFAEELRPLLESAMDANALSALPAPTDVVTRGRTRLLAQAAKMQNVAPVSRVSFFDLRLATAALTLLIIFFVGGTGIVQASTFALPGDSLYPIKLGWESTHYWFAGKDKIASIEAKHEEERREEVQELLGRGRLAAVRFEGVVTVLNGSRWEVAGVPVIVSNETNVEDAIQIGSDVIVSGQTQSDGAVLAETIVLSGHSEDHEEEPVETTTEASGAEEIDEPVETETPEPDDDEDEIEATETPDPGDGGDGDDDESDDENTEQDDGEGGDDGDDSEDGENDDEPDDNGDDHHDDDDNDDGDNDDDGDDDESDGDDDDDD